MYYDNDADLGLIKGKVSIIIYAVAIPLAFASPFAANALFVAVAVLWLVPDRRIERALASREESR